MVKSTGYGTARASVVPEARFGILTVIKRLPKEEKPNGKGFIVKVLCKCDCGNETTPDINSLVSDLTKSCGCGMKRKNAERSRQRAINNGGIPEPETRFGRLVVIRREEVNGLLTPYVLCKCDCGREIKSPIKSMKQGHSLSCGCWQSEGLIQRSKEIGKYGCFSSEHPRTHNVWYGMIKRCYNEKAPGYNYYGGKGVVVCLGLRKDPRNLVEVIGLKKGKLTLDRYPIHNGNYTCGECWECIKNDWDLNIRWATQKQQQRNKGDFNVWLEAFGKKRTRGEWIERSGLPEGTFSNRLKRGRDIEEALTTPNALGQCYDPVTDGPKKPK